MRWVLHLSTASVLRIKHGSPESVRGRRRGRQRRNVPSHAVTKPIFVHAFLVDLEAAVDRYQACLFPAAQAAQADLAGVVVVFCR